MCASTGKDPVICFHFLPFSNNAQETRKGSSSYAVDGFLVVLVFVNRHYQPKNSPFAFNVLLNTEIEPNTKHHKTLTSSQKMSDFEDAINYVRKVKREFADRPFIYNNFLEILKSFDSEDNFDADDLILRAADIFIHGENKMLILGLNPFLPDGYKIEIHGCGTIFYSMPRCHHVTIIYVMNTYPAPAA